LSLKNLKIFVLQLKAGAHSVDNLDPVTVQVRKISSIHVHPLFRDGILVDYDIAIAKTIQPFQITRYVSVIERSRQKPQGYFDNNLKSYF
jgi:hypothetical protein